MPPYLCRKWQSRCHLHPRVSGNPVVSKVLFSSPPPRPTEKKKSRFWSVCDVPKNKQKSCFWSTSVLPLPPPKRKGLVLGPLVTYPKTKCLVFGPLVGPTPPHPTPNPWFQSIICGLQKKFVKRSTCIPQTKFSFSGTLMCPPKKLLVFGPFVSSPTTPPPPNREKNVVFWAGGFESKFSSRSLARSRAWMMIRVAPN